MIRSGAQALFEAKVRQLPILRLRDTFAAAIEDLADCVRAFGQGSVPAVQALERMAHLLDTARPPKRTRAEIQAELDRKLGRVGQRTTFTVADETHLMEGPADD